MEKNELAILGEEKTELQNIVYECFKIKNEKTDEISLYDLLFYHISVQKNIEDKIDTLWKKIKQKFKDAFLESWGKEVGKPCYHNRSCYLDIYFSLKSGITFGESDNMLRYRKMDGEIYLVKGPSNMESIYYKGNELLMTELYPYFEKLFHLYELKEQYTDRIKIEKNGFSIELNSNTLKISKKYKERSPYSLHNDEAFFLVYKVREKGEIEKQIFSSFRDIMVLLKDREEEFLKGFYVDKSSLKEDTRELLDEYLGLNPISSEIKEESAKQKSIFSWLKRTFNSNSN